MISLDLWRSRIGGWRGHAKSQFLPPHYRKSTLSMFCLLWRITTCLSAITISVLLLIGGIELNPGPGSTSGDEISPMEIEDSIHDTFDFSSETIQGTPISSQVVPMTSLDLSSECSYDVSMTPEKSLSTPKSGKRKGYQARKNRNRASMKKRRVDDEDFRKIENESRLKRFNDDYEDSDFRAKHNENQLASITKRLEYPVNRAEQNVRNLVSMTKRLENPEKRAEQNIRSLVSMTKRLENPEKRAEQNIRSLVSMTKRLENPEKRAEQNVRNLASMTKRLENPEKRAEQNVRNLASMTKRLENPEKRAEQNVRNLASMTKKLENPEKRAEQNVRNLASMTKRLENPEKRAEQNVRNLASMTKRLENPEKRAEHNRYVLQKYKSGKGNFISVTVDYFFQISEGPTYVCSCCGCLHFRKSVVILTRARLDSMGDQTIIDQVCYLSL